MRHLALSLVLLLPACSAMPDIKSPYELQIPEHSGVAIGTIGYDSPEVDCSLHIVAQDSGKSYEIRHAKGQEPDTVLPEKGSQFAVAMPAGDYILKGWKVTRGTAIIPSQQPLDFPFRIEAGQATYLGHYQFRQIEREEPLPAAVSVTLSDRRERELPILRSTYPLMNVQLAQTVAPGVKIENVGASGAAPIPESVFVQVAR